MFLDDGFCLLGTEKVCRDFKLALAWGGAEDICEAESWQTDVLQEIGGGFWGAEGLCLHQLMVFSWQCS